MKTTTALVLAGLLALALAPATYAQACGGEMPGSMMMHHRGHGMTFPLHALGLTSDQRTKVDGIMKSHRPKLDSLFKQLHDGKEQISARLVTPGQLSSDDLAPMVKHNAEIEQQIGQETLKTALEIRALLTPAQLAKAAQILQKMKQIKAEMQGLFGDTPPPPPPPES